MFWNLNLISNILKSEESSRIKKFIIKNIDFPRFFGYFNYSKIHIKSTLYFIKTFLPINLFRISESKIPRRIFIKNSAKYELDPLEKQSKLFKKGYLKKTLDPPYLNPQSSKDIWTIIIKCIIDNCR
jgi:hypothetical protein